MGDYSVEIILVALLLLGYTIYYQIQAKAIQIAAKRSPFRVVCHLVLGSACLYLFWPKTLSDQISLTVLGVLLILMGRFKEGLTPEKLVKFGVLNGSFDQYQKFILLARPQGIVEIKCLSQTRRTDTSLLVEGSLESVETFLRAHVPDNQIAISKEETSLNEKNLSD